MTNFGLISSYPPPLRESWIGPKPTNRLFRLLYSPIPPPFLPDLYFEGWNERKTRRSLDNGGGFLEKKKKKKKKVSTDLVDSIRFDREKIRSGTFSFSFLPPRKDSIRFPTCIFFNLYASTEQREAKQRFCCVSVSGSVCGGGLVPIRER